MKGKSGHVFPVAIVTPSAEFLCACSDLGGGACFVRMRRRTRSFGLVCAEGGAIGAGRFDVHQFARLLFNACKLVFFFCILIVYLRLR